MKLTDPEMNAIDTAIIGDLEGRHIFGTVEVLIDTHLTRVWENFRQFCSKKRPAPDMGGKDCLMSMGNWQNKSKICSCQTCPLMK